MEKRGCNVIFFGETHGFVSNETKCIEKVIKKFLPKIILYELLEDKKLDNFSKINSFLKKSDSKRFSIISKYGELKGVVRLSKKYRLPVFGCDLRNLGRKNPILLGAKLTKKQMAQEEKILKKREKYQIDIIKTSSRKYKLLLVIVGAYHLRNNSPLRKLKNSKFILPKYKGKEIFSPEGISKNRIYYSI